MKFAEMKEQCKCAGLVKEDAGIEVCGCNKGLKCCGHSCPSKKWRNMHGQDYGKHKMAALENVGLVEEYKKEMEECTTN